MAAAHRTSESAASDHASQEAARGLIPPAPRPCSLALTVTTPLYRTSVSQALWLPLRGRAGRTSEKTPSETVCLLPRTPLLRGWVNRGAGGRRRKPPASEATRAHPSARIHGDTHTRS